MAGYVRKDTANNIADGNVINASDFDNEFDGIQDAFNSSTGHVHDGTTGNGGPISSLGPTQDVVVSATAVTPKTNNIVDVGSAALKFKNLHLAGTAAVDGTLAVTGVTTLTAQPVLSSLTASQAVFTNGTKGLVSNAITGTGNVVMSTSPTLVTPALGTPSALVGTNITGTASGLTAGNVTTNANLTGAVTSVGNATSLGSFTSAALLGALTDETGTGSAVFATSPTLVTPILGTPASGTVTNLTGTASININGTVGATTPTTGNFTTVDATNVEVTNIKAKDGTASISLADTTGIATFSKATVVSTTDNTNAALRITQLGTGNAFVVEDSTSPDSTPFVIDASGNVTVGGSSAPSLTVSRASSINAVIALTNTAGSMFIGNSDGNTFAVDSDSNLTLNPLFAVTNEGATTIAANSTSDALRITQTGTGNALLVEDAANPDATPFVIDASGRVLVGTNSTTTGLYTTATIPALFLSNAGSASAGLGESGLLLNHFLNNTNPSSIEFSKARGTSSVPLVVASGDEIGRFIFSGYDGATPLELARISASVDGSPGTNDMPGRLVFSTTADGAAAPTERMRISATGAFELNIADMTAANPSAFQVNSTAKAGQTGNMTGVISTLDTSAAYTGAGGVIGFYANEGTFTVAPTNQYGFYYAATNTGATNNYAFWGGMAAGTGRYNFYASGTANNYFAGNVGIGTAAPLTALNINGTGGELLRLSVTPDGGVIQEPALGFATGVTNTHPAAKISALEFDASDSRASLLFYTRDSNSDVAPTERMRIDSSGNVLIGTTTAISGSKLVVSGANANIYGLTVGRGAGAVATNTAVGASALGGGSQTGASNTAIGGQTLASATTAAYNTAIGYWAGAALTTGSGNTFVGSFQSGGTAGAGSAVTTGSKNVIIGGYTGGAAPISATGNNYIVLSDGDGSVRQTIDSSGNLMVGTTNTNPIASNVTGNVLLPGGGIRISNSGSASYMGVTATSGTQVSFYTYSGGAVLAGSITCPTSTTTSYTSVSDYRLKEAIAPMTGALEKVAALKPVTYKWKTDGSDGQGFIAHELQDIISDCVVGAKDEVDSDGNPKYQSIDTSFLVATLTAAIQEQQTLITALTARITALEQA